jgi:pimeloyl-ACP methyl ester carboxylesterase
MKMLIIKLIGQYLNVLSFISPSKAARRGFLLFCQPFRVPLSEKQRGFFNTAERFEIQAEGCKAQGYRWGNGSKKILFLHGWQSHTYRWKPYIEALSKSEYTIYSLDAPGHGLSTGNFLSVPLYSSFIETTIKHLDGVHTVVGHSLGSFSLLYTIHRFPLLPLEKIILMAPPGEADDFISVFEKTLGVSKRTLKLITDEFVRRYEVGPDYFSTAKFARSLNVKGLIIHDEDDQEAPYHYSIPLQKTWTKSRLITTKGFGHNLRSPSVVKEVVSFVEDASPVGAL